eukprot:3591110-Pleurochrysis_carterae.AAC.1
MLSQAANADTARNHARSRVLARNECCQNSCIHRSTWRNHPRSIPPAGFLLWLQTLTQCARRVGARLMVWLRIARAACAWASACACVLQCVIVGGKCVCIP